MKHRRLITFSRVIRAGLVNFVRNAWLAIAAMAVMVVTLTIVLFSVITNATFSNTIANITSKIDVSVYLQDNVTVAQRDNLLKQLREQPNVQSVTYLSKDQALQNYKQQNAGNQQLLMAISETENPLPATIQVKPRDLNKIQDIKVFLAKPANAALQTSDSPSYNGDRKAAIDKIAHATSILRRAGIVAVLVFTLISVLIIFNTIQMAIFNRRDELTIMRLLGAGTWYIRGPFVVESIVYGVLSAVISVLLINALFIASSSALQASSLGLLDIGYAAGYFSKHFWMLLTVQLLLGILIGAASSVVATRRYLKFKSIK
ncbi:MAG TPA: permease-like cell division protein FtsX [Candidatus Saccharimonadales bacterium]|nr:permease-like cell division protein FtsX [Candidatus Saccharimonadales bacterium]